MKNIVAVIGLLILFILIFGGSIANINNTAIRYEVQVDEQFSNIRAQERRRQDLVKSLVSTVEQASNFEGETLQKVIEARASSERGDVGTAMANIQAVAEAYPILNSIDLYKQLMLEISTTENLIVEQRKTYNSTVSRYNSYTRSFPASMFIQRKDIQMLELEVEEYNPELF